MSLSGAFGFGAFYFILLNLVFALLPEFLEQWNRPNLWGIMVGRVPADEIAWAVCFGMAWPASVAYVLGGKWVPLPAPDPNTRCR